MNVAGPVAPPFPTHLVALQDEHHEPHRIRNGGAPMRAMTTKRARSGVGRVSALTHHGKRIEIMTIAAGIELPEAEIAEICRRHQVRELSLFGSAAAR